MNKDPSLLASLIQNSWVSKNINIEYYENPYRHLIIDNLFSKEVYSNICEQIPILISQTVPYKDTPGATSNYAGYIKGISGDYKDTLGIGNFLSLELKNFLSNIFEVETNQYVATSAHWHGAPSESGYIHRDSNICSFLSSDKQISMSGGCVYTDDSDKNPDTIKVIRSIAMLYYANNPENIDDYVGGSTGIYDGYQGKLIKEVKALNNRLLVFEVCPNSYHAFIGANFDRSALVQWYHCSPAYFIHRNLFQIKKDYKIDSRTHEGWGISGTKWSIENDPEYSKYFGESKLRDILLS